MTLKHLSNEELHLSTITAVEREREATLTVLWHLRENERRLLFAERGHKDLKTYCVKELKLSEGSAWRRIAAVKLLKEIPETMEKFRSGQLSLTQICQAQSFFRQERPTLERKREILGAIENQGAKTERILCELGADAKVEPCRERPVKGGKVEVTLVLDEETLKQMGEIEIFLNKKLSKLELVKLMTAQTLERLKKPPRKRVQVATAKLPRATKPEAQSAIAAKAGATVGPRKPTRKISTVTIREIKARDNNQCQYKTSTGEQCEARLYLQTEHKTPWAKGGTHEHQNLELLCPNHNQWRALQQFGTQKMKLYQPRLE